MEALRTLRTAAKRFLTQHGFFLGSALAFDLLIYSIPLFILGISIISKFNFTGSPVEPYFLALVEHWLPHANIGATEIFFPAIKTGIGINLASFVSIFVMSGGLLASVRIVLHRIFDTPQPHTGIKARLRDLSIMTVLGLMFGAIVIAMFLFHSAEMALKSNEVLRPILEPGYVLLNTLLRFALSFSIFFCVFYIHGKAKISRKGILTGTFSAVILFELAKYLLDLYVSTFSKESFFYGALGAFIFYFVWLYYSALSFVFSACLAWSVGTNHLTKV